jgi:hypothetical protein
MYACSLYSFYNIHTVINRNKTHKRVYRDEKYCRRFFYTKPNILVLIAYCNFNFNIVLDEYNGTYKRLIHVFAVGKC